MKLAYSVEEAANLLSVSPEHIRRLIRGGLLGKVPHCGTRMLIAHAELERFAAAGVLHEGAAA